MGVAFGFLSIEDNFNAQSKKSVSLTFIQYQIKIESTFLTLVFFFMHSPGFGND
jgi:hypothetical protein